MGAATRTVSTRVRGGKVGERASRRQRERENAGRQQRQRRAAIDEARLTSGLRPQAGLLRSCGWASSDRESGATTAKSSDSHALSRHIYPSSPPALLLPPRSPCPPFCPPSTPILLVVLYDDLAPSTPAPDGPHTPTTTTPPPAPLAQNASPLSAASSQNHHPQNLLRSFKPCTNALRSVLS